MGKCCLKVHWLPQALDRGEGFRGLSSAFVRAVLIRGSLRFTCKFELPEIIPYANITHTPIPVSLKHSRQKHIIYWGTYSILGAVGVSNISRKRLLLMDKTLHDLRCTLMRKANGLRCKDSCRILG